MNVMIIGSGGREHALCRAFVESGSISEIICIPGNAGTAAEPKTVNIALPKDVFPDPNGAAFFAETAKKYRIDFVVVGPEAPLCAGFADALWNQGIPVVGPKKQAAELEGSKDFAKNFMKKYGVACADSITVSNIAAAKIYIGEKGVPLVIKADGLAAGKGVVVTADQREAFKTVDLFMNAGSLGQAGKKLVLEEYLQGSEISILAAVSVTPALAEKGKAAIIPFVPARDHKRLLDGARGVNTGGMGAIAPVPGLCSSVMKKFKSTILEPTLKGLIAENADYRGFIFFGLMLTSSGPKLLEYNVRLGDPETQAVLPLLDCDFAQLCTAILDIKNEGTLKKFALRWKKGFVCAPVVVSGGYPEMYKTGYEIMIERSDSNRILKRSGTLHNNNGDIKIFMAGAECRADSVPVTAGGRVLCVSAFAAEKEHSATEKTDSVQKKRDECMPPALAAARRKAYRVLKTIKFENMFYRKDIGLPGAADSREI